MAGDYHVRGFQYSINIGVWRQDQYKYLINFYTNRVGATFRFPDLVMSAEYGLRVIHQISAHGWVYALIPATGPNPLPVMHRLISIERNKPILALNIHLQEYGSDGAFKGKRGSVYLHDVKFIDFAPAVARGVVYNKDGSATDDNDIIANFNGVVGPTQNISGSLGV